MALRKQELFLSVYTKEILDVRQLQWNIEYVYSSHYLTRDKGKKEAAMN